MRPALLAPLLALALAACSEDKTPLFCPKVAVLTAASRLIRASGPRNDIAARILDARVTGVAGSCTTKGKGRAQLVFRIGFAASAGPAATAPTATLRYFIALTQGETIIDKKLYPVTFDFADGAPQAVATTTPIKIILPNVPRSAGQQVLVGFQMTPTELGQQ